MLLLCAGAYRGPQPPSMLSSMPGGPSTAVEGSDAGSHATPEALAALGVARTSMHSPLVQYQYEWQQGFVGAGDDVAPPRTMTIAAALAACDAAVRCRSVTHVGVTDTTGEVHAYLKSAGGASGSAGWSTWVKVADVGPPAADISVGGSSRLRLLLRAHYFTAQNLSRVGESWSFTRPLDRGSALPMSAHLGDVTIRVRRSGPVAASGGGRPGGEAEMQVTNSLLLQSTVMDTHIPGDASSVAPCRCINKSTNAANAYSGRAKRLVVGPVVLRVE